MSVHVVLGFVDSPLDCAHLVTVFRRKQQQPANGESVYDDLSLDPPIDLMGRGDDGRGRGGRCRSFPVPVRAALKQRVSAGWLSARWGSWCGAPAAG